MKVTATGLTVFAFVIAPLVFADSKHKIVRYLTPSKYFALSFLGIVIISRLAHYLRDIGLGSPGIQQNIGEFRELGTYYLYVIYTFTLVCRRHLSTGNRDCSQRSVPSAERHPD